MLIKCYITLEGGEGSTTVEMFLTPHEYNLIAKLSDLTKEEAHYSCMPRLTLKKADNKVYEYD